MIEKIPTGLLGRKGELLITNRLLSDYEVFFPYYDMGIDLIVKKKNEKRFFTIQCRTRDFRDKPSSHILSIRKEEFETMKTNLDFLVFVLYGGEDDIRFIVFPFGWLEKIVEKIKQRKPVEKNYTLLIRYKDNKITYEPKGLRISKDELNMSRFIDERGWQQLR